MREVREQAMRERQNVGSGDGVRNATDYVIGGERQADEVCYARGRGSL